MRFENKVVWITGASSGIGEALAYAFSREGAKLILSGRRDAELERVKRGCAGPAENVFVLPLDLTQFDTFGQKTKQAESHFGRVDILVNNGGITHRSLVAESSVEVELAVMNTNYFGSILLTKAVLPAMLAAHSGHIVVVSSLMGYLDTPMRSAYAASKHALQGYFDSLRAEVWRQNIKVILICPGFVKTAISLNALAADGSKHGRMDRTQQKGISAEKCAAKMLDAIARGREEVLIGGLEVLAVYVKRFLPWVYSAVIRKINVA